jgi:hypothetical protein
VTHNRKPDVPPAAGASIAEALECLDSLSKLVLLSETGMARKLKPIRSALERAAAEGAGRPVVDVPLMLSERDRAHDEIRRLNAELRAARAAPPADEVAGLPK